MPQAVPTPEQRTLLKELRAGWAFAWTSSQTPPPYPGGPPGPGKAKRGEECKCILADTLTGKAFAVAVGPDEPAAFNRVMEKAKTAEQPMTPAEQAVEINRLKAELAAVRAGQPAPVPPPALTPTELEAQADAQDELNEVLNA